PRAARTVVREDFRGIGRAITHPNGIARFLPGHRWRRGHLAASREYANRANGFSQAGEAGEVGEAGTAAWTPARAACSAASLVWPSEVFITLPPSPLRPSSTLSAVTLRTSTNSAAVPGWMVAAVSFIHVSLRPTSLKAPPIAPEAAPMAAPASGI